MKKRSALILSAIMVLSVAMAAFGAMPISAAKAGSDHIDAIMSDVVVDCIYTTSEYVMDTVKKIG